MKIEHQIRSVLSSKLLCLLILLIFQGLTACNSSNNLNHQESNNNQTQTIPLQIISAQDGKLISEFNVEIADDPQERALGLMHRTELGADRGMLFIYPEDNQSTFWMKDTLISLDMIFIGADQKIVSIIEEAEPLSLEPRRANGPYRYVLEIEGGRTRELGVKVEDQVNF